MNKTQPAVGELAVEMEQTERQMCTVTGAVMELCVVCCSVKRLRSQWHPDAGGAQRPRNQADTSSLWT